MSVLRVAGLQTAGSPGQVQTNLDELDSSAAQAIAAGAGLLITPEMFVTGYDIGEARVAEFAGLDLVGLVAQIAKRHGIAILVGLPLGTDHGVVNAAVLIDSSGVPLVAHSKTHLFGDLDRSMFIQGHTPVSMVEYSGVKIALLICYDVEFPENVRAAALEGAHLVAVPTAQMEPFRFVADHLIRVRAWENQVYVAYINHIGQEGSTAYVGGSSICGPDGSVLAHADRDRALIIADIDTEVVARGQMENPYLEDLRIEMFRGPDPQAGTA